MIRCLCRTPPLRSLRRLSHETPAQHRAFLLMMGIVAAELLLIAAALIFTACTSR